MASARAGSAAAARAASSSSSSAPSPSPVTRSPSTHDDAPSATRKPLSFDCNICLDAVTSPVVTLCGHLYCWPCLYLWMAQHAECPVCKAGISDDNVIPVYGRGANAVDPRDQPVPAQSDAPETNIPDRPRGQRLDPELMRRRRPRHPLGAFSASPTLGIFPAFFGGGGPFGPTLSPTHRADGTPLTPHEARQQMQQAFLSRLLLIVGSLVLLCLLTF